MLNKKPSSKITTKKPVVAREIRKIHPAPTEGILSRESIREAVRYVREANAKTNPHQK